MKLLSLLFVFAAVSLESLPLVRVHFQETAKISVEAKLPVAVTLQNKKDTVLDDSLKALNDELAAINTLAGIGFLVYGEDSKKKPMKIASLGPSFPPQSVESPSLLRRKAETISRN